MTDGPEPTLPDPPPGPGAGSDPIPADDHPPEAPEGVGPPPPPPPPAVEGPGDGRARGHRRGHGDRWPIRRSVRDRKVRGVAGGVAAAADVDPILVRLLFAAAALTGWGIVAYVVLAVVLRDETVDDPARPLSREPRRLLRIGMVVAAAVTLGSLFDGRPFGGDGIGLPLVLIALGGAVLWARRDEQAPATGGWPEPSSPAATGWPGTGSSSAAAWPPGPADPGRAHDPTSVPPTPEGPAPWPTEGAPRRLGGGISWRSMAHDLVRLAAAFAAVGAFLLLVAGTFVVAVDAVPMRLPFLPAAIAAGGLLALVTAVVRRAGPSILLLSGGVLVVAAVLAVGLASFPGGAGERIVAVGPDTPLLDRYDHSLGRLVLDLHQLSLEPGTRRRVVARVGTGQLSVIVPPSLAVDVRARTGAGDTRLFGREQSGTGVRVNGRRDAGEGAGRLDLDLSVGIGEVTVELPSARLAEGARPVDPAPPASPVAPAAPVAPPASGGVPSVDGTPLACGAPAADGVRTCTPAPAGSTSTTVATYACREDPATRQLTCVPG